MKIKVAENLHLEKVIIVPFFVLVCHSYLQNDGKRYDGEVVFDNNCI